MTNIFWYSEPIKTIKSGDNVIQYCKWQNGYRLYSVNGRGCDNLSNSQFIYWLEFISTNVGGV